ARLARSGRQKSEFGPFPPESRGRDDPFSVGRQSRRGAAANAHRGRFPGPTVVNKGIDPDTRRALLDAGEDGPVVRDPGGGLVAPCRKVAVSRVSREKTADLAPAHDGVQKDRSVLR